MAKAKWQAFENPAEDMTKMYSAFRKRSSLIQWEKIGGVRNAFGVVRIIKILRGKDYDLVLADIGFGQNEAYLRKFICKTQFSRKQIYTLTLNQYAIVYALVSKSGKAYYVKCWWASYVPKVHDRIEIEENEGDKFTRPMMKSDMDKEAIDFLNDIETRLAKFKNEK